MTRKLLLATLLLCGAAYGQIYTDVAPHTMVSASAPAPFHATASGQFGGFGPWGAFGSGGAGTDGWIDNVTGSCWIQMDLGFAYTLYQYTVAIHEAARAPKTWTFAGSNDNFSTHTDLDTQTNITWTDSTQQTFTIASPGSYRYYRLTSSVNSGDATFTAIAEFYFNTIESSWGKSYLPQPVQSCNINGAACAMHNNVVSGNILFVAAHREATLSTPSDTRSTTFTLIDSSVGSVVSLDSYLWCGVLGSSGADTITVTSADGVIAMEYPATAGFTCTKDHSENGVSGAFNPYAPIISTTQNGELMVLYMAQRDNSLVTVPHEGGAVVAVGTQNGNDGGLLAFRYGALAGTEFGATDVKTTSTSVFSPYIFASFQPSGITIMTTALPTGATSNSYSYTLQAIGGAGAYTWSVSSGALPTGLSLNASTGAITGTPTGASTTPTFQVTDGTHTTTKSLTLTTNGSAGSMSIVSSVSISATTGSLGTVTSGNCIAALVFQGRQSIYPLTDSLGTVFQYAGLHYAPNLSTGWGLWYGVATSTGSDTLTTMASQSGTLAVQIANCQAFGDVSAGNAGVNGGSVTLSGTSLTTLMPNSEIWSGVIGGDAGATWTAGTGFSTSGDGVLSNCCQGIHATTTTVGAYTPSFVQSGNTGGLWSIWGIAFRPSTSGAVNTNHRRAWVTQSN